MTPSNHALERWSERFSDLCIKSEFAKSSRVGKKTKQAIRRKCPNQALRFMYGFRGRYYTKTHRGIVFVVGRDETIITVFELSP